MTPKLMNLILKATSTVAISTGCSWLAGLYALMFLDANLIHVPAYAWNAMTFTGVIMSVTVIGAVVLQNRLGRACVQHTVAVTGIV